MTALSFDAVAAILIIPVVAAALLATLPSYRMTARLNVAASALTLLSALSLLLTDRPQPGQYLLVDDLNIVFIVLNTFVGFTTSKPFDAVQLNVTNLVGAVDQVNVYRACVSP